MYSNNRDKENLGWKLIHRTYTRIQLKLANSDGNKFYNRDAAALYFFSVLPKNNKEIKCVQ